MAAGVLCESLNRPADTVAAGRGQLDLDARFDRTSYEPGSGRTRSRSRREARDVDYLSVESVVEGDDLDGPDVGDEKERKKERTSSSGAPRQPVPER